MARNLKSMALIRQARQKVGHTIQKSINESIQNHHKIDENRCLDWSWGSWGRPWEPFCLPKLLRAKKEARQAKCVRLGAPIWVFSTFSAIVRCFLRPFLDSPFWWLPGSFFDGIWYVVGIICKRLCHNFPDCRQIRKMSFWYNIYYVWGTSASWKRAETIEIPGTFLATFSEMATDTLFHRFWVDSDSILACFLVLPAKKSCAKTWPIWHTFLWSRKRTDPRIPGLATEPRH